MVAADGRGHWTLCRHAGDGALEPESAVAFDPPAAPPLTVAFVPGQGDSPKWVVQKLTELGIDRIAVLRSARSVVRWRGPREAAALDRLRRVAEEAAAQSRRVRLPEVCGVLTVSALDPAVALAEPGAPRLGAGTTAVAVGPEGGWSDEELAPGRAQVGLGDGVLRAETAAVAAGVLLAARRTGTVGDQEWPR